MTGPHTPREMRLLGTCTTTGKRQFTQRRWARKAAKATARGLAVYQCHDCGLWHVGGKRGLTREQHRQAHRKDPQ